MADAIVRLKVESQEYDSKLERATQKLQHMEKECRKIGGTFEYVDKEQLDLVKSLGQMETKATSAKGKVAEMTKSYTELSLQYKRLSDQEKQSPFGKAMAQSLDQLKSRIKDTNAELKDVSQELGEGGGGLGGIMEALAGKIGIPVEMFTKLGAAAAGVGAALKVATDALKQNEIVMDAWGVATETASTMYGGFLNALNTGDFSGFFRSMDDIVLAARAAYDAMDELGTFNAFNQINKEKSKTEFQQSIADYREGTGSKDAVVAASQKLIGELETQRQKEQEAYIKEIERIAAERGVSSDLLKQALSGSYGDYQTIKEVQAPRISYQSMTGTGKKYTVEEILPRSEWSEIELLGDMLRKFTDDELNALQALGAQANRTATEMEQVRRQAIRFTGGGSKEGGGKSTPIVKAEEVLPAGSIAEVKARIAELNKDLEKAADQTTRDKIKYQINDLRAELKEMTDSPLFGQNSQVIPLSVELLDTSTKRLTEEVNALREKLGMKPIEIGIKTNGKGGSTVDTAKQTEQAWSAAANAIQSIGGALQQIEDPSAKVAGIIMQAVANIALGFAQAAASPATGAAGVFGWIAAATAGLATMTATISSIKSVTKGGFANGGIVPGNSFSGDNLHTSDYGINSGELILNRAQQNTIASQLQGGAAQNMRLEALISGESLRMVLANNASRRGGSRSQYAISKFG